MTFLLAAAAMNWVGFLVTVSPGRPMETYNCSFLYGTFSVGSRSLQITLVVYCFLVSLFSFTKPLLLAGFSDLCRDL